MDIVITWEEEPLQSKYEKGEKLYLFSPSFSLVGRQPNIILNFILVRKVRKLKENGKKEEQVYIFQTSYQNANYKK